MEVTALCSTLMMLEFTLLSSYSPKSDAAFFRIAPNRLQHFQYESISFHCEGADGAPKFKVIWKGQEHDPLCRIRKTSAGSSCTIDKVYLADSGEYWCETGGQRSSRANISITAGSVILESPTLPVEDGESVTLSCRTKTTPANKTALFYKDGRLIRSSSTGDFTLHNVSESDGGLYSCSMDGFGESAESQLAVRVSSGAAVNFFSSNTNQANTCGSAEQTLRKLCRNSDAGSVILESPLLPVKEGNNVTLSCRNQMVSSNFTADFYKDGVLFSSSSTGNTTISSVSKSDEGLYRCSSSGGDSAESWLAVRAPHRETCPCSHHFLFVLLLLRTVFTIVMVFLLLLLLGLLHCGKLTANQK